MPGRAARQRRALFLLLLSLAVGLALAVLRVALHGLPAHLDMVGQPAAALLLHFDDIVVFAGDAPGFGTAAGFGLRGLVRGVGHVSRGMGSCGRLALRPPGTRPAGLARFETGFVRRARGQALQVDLAFRPGLAVRRRCLSRRGLARLHLHIERLPLALGLDALRQFGIGDPDAVCAI